MTGGGGVDSVLIDIGGGRRRNTEIWLENEK
jgi:hypothetical protein